MNNKDELSKIMEKFSPKRTFTRMHDKIHNDKLDDDIYPRTIIWLNHDEKPLPLVSMGNPYFAHPVPYWYPPSKEYTYIRYMEEVREISDRERNKERDEAICNLACILYQQNTETE